MFKDKNKIPVLEINTAEFVFTKPFVNECSLDECVVIHLHHFSKRKTIVYTILGKLMLVNLL